jgi:Recombination endonuclease VII
MPSLSKLFTRAQIDAIRKDLIAKHGDRCALCDKPGSHFKKRLAVDHDHKTNKIRGLLCFRCNKYVLGRLTLAVATKIVSYLEKYG